MSAPRLADEVLDELSPAFVTADQPYALEVSVLSALLAPLQPMVDIVLDDDGPYASVFNGTISDPRPLGWGAQWPGTDPRSATEVELRDATYLRRRWGRGSLQSITDAVQRVLTGSRRVTIHERRDPVDFSVDQPYHLTIVTRIGETPGGVQSVLDALVPVVKARIVLHVAVADGTTWQDLTDTGITWQTMTTGGVTWQDLASGTYP